jgi:hypothetical protein
MSSNVQLCNKALRRLGEDPIIALDDKTVWGRRCLTALPEVTRTVLALDAWRSVTSRIELAAESETPLGYASAYPLPADCLRLVGIKLGQYTDWAIEGNKILTKQSKETSLQILYVREDFDTNKYTPPLFDAIAMGLAHELSGYSTATNVSKDEIYQFFVQAVAMGQSINSKETPITFLASTSWIDVRMGNQDRSVYNNGVY